MLRRRIVTTLVSAGLLSGASALLIGSFAAPAGAQARPGQISVDLPFLPPVELPGPPISVGVGSDGIGVGGPEGEVTIPPPSIPLPRPTLPAAPLTVPDLPAPNVSVPPTTGPDNSSPGDVEPAPTPAPSPAAGVDARPAPAPPGAARSAPAPNTNTSEDHTQAAPPESPVRITASLDATGTPSVWSRIGSAAVSFGPWLMLLAIALIVRGVAASALRERRVARNP